MDVKIKIHVHKDKKYVKTPHFFSQDPTHATKSGTDGFYATSGVGPDLLGAAKEAVRSMIDWLSTEHGLEPRDAYFLCSIVVDLKITGELDYIHGQDGVHDHFSRRNRGHAKLRGSCSMPFIHIYLSST